MHETTKGPAGGNQQGPSVHHYSTTGDHLTLYDLLRAAELYRGRRGNGKGTRRALAQLRKEITGRKG